MTSGHTRPHRRRYVARQITAGYDTDRSADLGEQFDREIERMEQAGYQLHSWHVQAYGVAGSTLDGRVITRLIDAIVAVFELVTDSDPGGAFEAAVDACRGAGRVS